MQNKLLFLFHPAILYVWLCESEKMPSITSQGLKLFDFWSFTLRSMRYTIISSQKDSSTPVVPYDCLVRRGNQLFTFYNTLAND